MDRLREFLRLGKTSQITQSDQQPTPSVGTGGRSLSDLILLLLIRQENKSPRQCLREGHCKGLQLTFFACKRSMLDTRTRFRGRKGY
ncbi:cytochrome c oxidase assembly factor 5 [Phasianus colchicus]|uniref:cytochrome c oxidase assembly factor 5 n=1 Tax=Phasianus colchicus TaxID=9054 RepID=UPI00129EAFE5|nr:cytochrome c oxidase assembly factor 5 [Phasianus colchicus]